ncbi:d858b052-60d5-4555-b1b9-452c7d9a4e3d [Sclerotinia trifoliorum]|uniref:D858b052-60d5-4555-b1b9-452c7d9a4e3d n=1 Tax=Sclerotinia trifoliorum TaxID=28548 RepID=A0A8H2VPX7_9HELO|nr:d858b052-60d5-4555-b1b9-452c7d9a4e3d [Sclerotinia trifoliorum]
MKALIEDIRTQKSTFMLGLQVDEMNILLDALGDRKSQGLEIEAIRANVLALRNERSISVLKTSRRSNETSAARHRSGKKPSVIRTFSYLSLAKGPSGSSKETNSITGVVRKHQGCGCMVFLSISSVSQQLTAFPKTCSDLNLSRSRQDYIDPTAVGSRSWRTIGLIIVQIRTLVSGSKSTEQLCHLLQDISRYFNNVHLIIDALDERGDSRSNIARILAELNASKDSNVKIILSSSPEPDIEQHLADFVSVPIIAQRNDLELYVHSEMQRRQDDVRWVTCQFDHLCDLNSVKAISQALHSLPPTLNGTYERILDRINLSSDDTKGLVYRVLLWTVCSVVPLSLAELLEAVSVNPFDKKMDRDGIPAEKSILKRCSSLVRKTGGGGSFDTRIELSHFTVKEFLLLTIQDDTYASYRISQDYHNAYMTKVCLTYLLFEDFGDIIPYTIEKGGGPVKRNYAFYTYVTRYFVLHGCCVAMMKIF